MEQPVDAAEFGGRTEVVLVRHALSVPPTADGPDQFTRPLTPDGLRQAKELVRDLAVPAPVAVWSSPYLRAIQTVEPTASALGLVVQTRWELREWDDGLTFTVDWKRHYTASWLDPSLVRPDGESLDQLTERAVAAVRTLVGTYPGQRVLVGSHGTFVARALCGFDVPVSRAFWDGMPMPAVYRLGFDLPCAQPEVSGPGLPIGTTPGPAR
ncbi:histidine phosphatase family protein [Plantactinospora sp. B5E13]|uniref:histidine phosphatase family protein n=1 Tax=unclassified Plantactinospora TaxID=2631981 RepID=UPI00325F1D9A